VTLLRGFESIKRNLSQKCLGMVVQDQELSCYHDQDGRVNHTTTAVERGR
jgi:hypothetical protein